MFYGWISVGVAFAAQFLATGLIYYTFGVALKELAAEFDASRLGISGILLVMPWATALMAPAIGRIAGGGHLRALIFAGATAAGAGFCLASGVTALWQLYVIYSVLMAFATNCMSGVGSQTLVVNWFSQRRATALGISQMGASFGGMVLGPLAAVLFADHGWRNVYLGFGIATLALAPVLAWLTVGRPEEHGERPYGFEPSATGSPGSVGSSSPVLTARDAVRLPTLWLLAFIAGIGSMLSSAMVAHIVAFATDRGMPPLEASGLLSVMALGALAGKPVFGLLADRFGERPAYMLAFAIQSMGLGALAAVWSEAALYGLMLLFGLGVGGNLPLSAALLTRVFGPAAFGPMMGLKSLLAIPLVAAGAPLAGWVYDATGSYAAAFVSFSGLAASAVVALRAIRLLEAPTRAGA